MKKYLFIALLMLSTTFYASNTTTTDPSRLDDALATVVEKGLTLAEKTGTFVIEQAPELIQEFYQWHIYSNVFGIILGLLIIFTGYKIPFLWTTKEESKYSDDDHYFKRYCNDAFPGYAVFVIFSVIGLIFMFCCSYDLIYILTAPKLYLIEYFIK
jgi:hypothetical protein